MSDSPNEPSRNKQPRQLRGFYGKINVSVATLDKLIIIGIVAIVLVLFVGLQHRGYTVSFNSMGGTPVDSQEHMYGEYVQVPEDPTREGFSFAGWYQDKNCQYPWVFDENVVSESIELYADWTSK